MRFTLAALLLFLVGAALREENSRPARETDLKWRTSLAELPEAVRSRLIEEFGGTKESRMRDPERPKTDAEIITDQRENFSAGCSALPGQAYILFVKAAQLKSHWIVQYEHGGVVHGTDLIMLTADSTGMLRWSSTRYTRRDEATIEAIIKKIERSRTKH